ncbi:MAG: exodeoxyribonuclease VII large subunit [Endomicrobium sp.]|jgi:exodeoxyribonuclease VII large subunit|nr:exodeoxyribonuclease VII large subunit [Endomicrobium sp.]
MPQDLEFNFLSENKSAGGDGRLIYSVSKISSEIKFILEESYPSVWVKGEISNYKLYNSGHAYFSLKDEESQIRAVKFSAAAELNFEPEDGMEVLVCGRVSSYPKRGDYQIIVQTMEPYGKGGLAEKFEKLKKKLEAEGLFDESAKKPLPLLVSKIGVVTSQDGAALRDILKVLDDLNANVEVLIYPVRVQGNEAEQEISRAIKYLNKNYASLDVLLVGRGGGSAEDLQAFNCESVARAVFNSSIPVISCVGHETDFTISDFAADLRAPTPSAAAETAVRGRSELKNKLAMFNDALSGAMNSKIEDAQAALERIVSSRTFLKPYIIYEDKISYIDGLGERIRLNFNRLINFKSEKLADISHKLGIISPLSVLKRGFCICSDLDGTVIKDSADIQTGQTVNVKLSRGNFTAEVKNNA